jgi:preprotein translocase subunit SecF
MMTLASKRYRWFALSLLVIVPGLISLIFFGLKLGIDFTGGTAWEMQFQKPIDTGALVNVLAQHGYGDSVVQQIGQQGEHSYLIRMKELTEGSAVKQEIADDVTRTIGPFTQMQFSSVGGSLSTEIRSRAIQAIVLASIGILLYIAYAFRNTKDPIVYGGCAIVAMLHDVLVVLGIFSILGVLFGVEIDALFVTALLTVIGFSVHDTIVVFDRIRENLGLHTDSTFEGVVNYSLAQTVVRSLNTSMTVVFTLLALVLFGGGSTREFVLALLIGVISGTYSSIFNASQLLVAWQNHEIQDFFRRFTRGSGASVAPSR